MTHGHVMAAEAEELVVCFIVGVLFPTINYRQTRCGLQVVTRSSDSGIYTLYWSGQHFSFYLLKKMWHVIRPEVSVEDDYASFSFPFPFLPFPQSHDGLLQLLGSNIYIYICPPFKNVWELRIHGKIVNKTSKLQELVVFPRSWNFCFVFFFFFLFF